MNKIIVIGGGPAGMFAAIAAAETGSQVILLEKNEKLGKKLFITGKGRCNITNAGDMDNLFAMQSSYIAPFIRMTIKESLIFLRETD